MRSNGFAGTAVDQRRLAGFVETRHFQHALDIRFARAVEHGRCHRHADAQILRELQHFLVRQIRHVALVGFFAIGGFQLVAQIGQARLLALPHMRLIGVEHLPDLLAEIGRSPAEMRFQNLPHIHARRHAERIQHDIDRRAVFEIRHVLDRHDARDDALVAVTAGHLVARLQLALHGDEHLDHLHHARRQFVAALQLARPCPRNASSAR